jgi:TonB family protein
MLHDRFYGQWDQPTSIFDSNIRFVTTLKIRIQKDGTVSARSIVKSSGNAVMDESVLAAARRVSRVDPLPADFGREYYEVNINFELE